MLTPVELCLADARADHDRQGGINSDDLNRLTARYGLGPLDVTAVVDGLQSFGIEVEEVLDKKLLKKLSSTNDSVGRILQSAGRVPLLNAAEEVKLGRRISLGQSAAVLPLADQTDSSRRLVVDGHKAHEQLVLANVRLVVSIARRYVSPGMELSDIIQEGTLGLMRAADKYDHRMGYKFSTYATWWIRQSISRAMADKGRLIRLPVHFVDSLSQLRRIRGDLERSLNREPTLQELAQAADMDAGKVQATLDLAKEPVSLDELFPDSDTELVEVLNLYSSDVEDQVIEMLSNAEVERALEVLQRALANQTGAGAHAAEMLRLRFGLEDGEAWTLDQIGERYGVTRERVRQIIGKTLTSERLQAAFSALDPSLVARA